MGYDVTVRDYSVCTDEHDGTKYAVRNKDTRPTTLYMSYNFSDFRSVCPEHFGTVKNTGECCDRPKVHLWYLPVDMHGRQGTDVLERLQRALLWMAERQMIYPGSPPLEERLRSNWFYGLEPTIVIGLGRENLTEQLPPRERAQVFAHFLHCFLETARARPESFFMSDYGDRSQLTMSDDTVIEIRDAE